MTSARAAFLRRLTIATALYSIFIGVVVLLGWLLDIELLKALLPNLVPMKANSALGFVLAGMVLLALRCTSPRIRWGGFVCALLVFLLGLLTSLQYLFNVDFALDELLVRGPGGRMSSASALNFMLLGLVLLIMPRAQAGSVRFRRLNLGLLLIIAIISFVAILGFLYDVETLYVLFVYNQIALNSAVTFLVLVLGSLSIQPELNLWEWLLARDAGGRMSRRLLPVALLMPMLLGWVVIQVLEQGGLNPVAATALLVLLTSLLLTGVLSWYTYALHLREEIRRAEEQYRLELAIEQANLNLLAEFIQSTSHDLRTPLAAIRTSAYLARRLPDAEQRSARLTQIDENISEIERILEAFTTMAQLDASRSLEQSRLHFDGLVSAELDAVQGAAAAKGLMLERQLGLGEAAMVGSAEYLQALIRELLGNALRYTAAGGTVRVCTGQQGQQAVLEVADTGIGIAAQDLPHIFERHFKANRARTRDGSGSGLGLPIARRIVELHRGQIEVESVLNEGTLVRVILPLARG